MDNATHERLKLVSTFMLRLGAPEALVNKLQEDAETIFGLPGQPPADPAAAVQRMSEINAEIEALGLPTKGTKATKETQPDEASMQQLAEGLASALRDKLPGNVQVKVIKGGERLEDVLKGIDLGAEGECGHHLLLKGLVHDLKQLDLPAVNSLRSYRAALELLEPKPAAPQFTAEQQALIDGLTKAGAKQEIIDELRAQFLGMARS